MKKYITGIHHFALHPTTRAQYEKTVDFYCGLLGCEIIRSWDVDGRCGAFIDVGNSILELGLRDDGVEQYGAVHHIALSVEDLDEVLAHLKEAGYSSEAGAKIGELPTNPPFRAYVAFVKGPCGEDVEFFQEIGEVL